MKKTKFCDWCGKEHCDVKEASKELAEKFVEPKTSEELTAAYKEISRLNGLLDEQTPAKECQCKPNVNKEEIECKHDWIQDATIKVCLDCGYKPFGMNEVPKLPDLTAEELLKRNMQREELQYGLKPTKSLELPERINIMMGGDWGKELLKQTINDIIDYLKTDRK